MAARYCPYLLPKMFPPEPDAHPRHPVVGSSICGAACSRESESEGEGGGGRGRERVDEGEGEGEGEGAG